MGYRFAVIGAGLHGSAAAYDLARFGEADEVRLLDIELSRARDAAERVNRLIGREVAKSGVVNASDKSLAGQVLEGMHACLSAAPYALNLGLTRAAIDAGCHFADLGGSTPVVLEQIGLDKAAKAAGVSVIPDCGLAPGMANTLAVYGMQALDRPEDVHIRCGGLPQNRSLPLGYKKSHSLEGLTHAYFGEALVLRDGRVQTLEAFDGLESFDLPSIGKVEAFLTAGGTSTCPYTFEGELRSYDYKSIRYPGHYAQLKTLHDLGFIGDRPVDVRGQPVRPRDVFHALMERLWDRPDEPDLVVLRVDVEGEKAGRRVRHRSLVVDRADPETGFTAMERTTGFPAAIVVALMARGQTPVGAVPLERAVTPLDFVRELGRRDIPLETSLTELE